MKLPGVVWTYFMIPSGWSGKFQVTHGLTVTQHPGRAIRGLRNGAPGGPFASRGRRGASGRRRDASCERHTAHT